MANIREWKLPFNSTDLEDKSGEDLDGLRQKLLKMLRMVDKASKKSSVKDEKDEKGRKQNLSKEERDKELKLFLDDEDVVSVLAGIRRCRIRSHYNQILQKPGDVKKPLKNFRQCSTVEG